MANTILQIEDDEDILEISRIALDSRFKCDTEFLSEGLDGRLDSKALSRC